MRDGKGGVSLAVISAGVSDPSSTRLLADRLTHKSLAALARLDVDASASMIDLAPLAADIAVATVGGRHSERLAAVIRTLADADAVIAATPVYKAGMSGLFKSFIDLLDNDLLIARPVLLAGTAGSARHALVLEDQLRPLFAFLRTVTLPTAVMASPEDWSAPDLGVRIERAASELAHLVRAGVAEAITADTWGSHDHEFGGAAARTAETGIELETTLMRLAAGGTLTQTSR